MIKAEWTNKDALDLQPTCDQLTTDCISRQAAIDAINTWDKFGVDGQGRILRWHEGLEPYVHLRDVLTAIANLPSTQPEQKTVIYCGDGYADGCMVYDWAECPECGYPYEEGDKTWGEPYCPHCGQLLNWDMRGEQDE